MIIINGIELPQETMAIRLEPSKYLDAAIHSYSSEKDVLIYYVPTLISSFIDQGMTESEAWEWFHYNTLNTHIANYPIFIDHNNKEYL
jgi:hypothetical protein